MPECINVRHPPIRTRLRVRASVRVAGEEGAFAACLPGVVLGGTGELVGWVGVSYLSGRLADQTPLAGEDNINQSRHC